MARPERLLFAFIVGGAVGLKLAAVSASALSRQQKHKLIKQAPGLAKRGRIGGVWQQHERQRLLQAEVECTPDFVSNPDRYEALVLGPSSATDSLFKNVTYPNGQVVDLTELPVYLIYPLYIYPSQPTFVQENEFFGDNFVYTEEILSQHELLVDFWKTGDKPCLLIGLHSEALQKVQVLTETVESHYFDSGSDPDLLTDQVLANVVKDIRVAIEEELPGNYSNPALTNLAFFIHMVGITGFEEASVIVFGDGVWDWVEWLGLEKVGASFIHAHEFAHFIQHIVDLEDNGAELDQYNTPEGSRRFELEADAMGAYALAHPQGGNWPIDQLLQASRLTFSRGKCNVDEPGHHGTPNQRECATLWGADTGLDMTGDPVSMRAFRELFNRTLDLILAVDPSVCKLDVESPTSSPISLVAPSSSPNGNAHSPTISPDTEPSSTAGTPPIAKAGTSGSEDLFTWLSLLAAPVLFAMT